MPEGRVSVHGFDLRVENGFAEDEARVVVERALATPGDRVSFVMDRPNGPTNGRPARIFVKAEFRRPNQALGRRVRPARAIAEGRGYLAFADAKIPTARVFAFGEQSRLRPRAGALVVTEKLRGRNASQTWKLGVDPDAGTRVARTLGAIHAADLVHGDAALRNFVLLAGVAHAIDLPRWSLWTPGTAEADLAQFLGTTMKLGADAAAVARLLDAYESTEGGPAARLFDGWRERVVASGDAYRRRLVERDATRPERLARKKNSALRPKERSTSTERSP